MLNMENSNYSNNDFVLETTERFKINVFQDGHSLVNTSNSFEHLKNVYDELIRDNINSNKHLVVSIYDYHKDTNVEYYDSDQERC